MTPSNALHMHFVIHLCTSSDQKLLLTRNDARCVRHLQIELGKLREDFRNIPFAKRRGDRVITLLKEVSCRYIVDAGNS